jgi:NADH-quinone oxidoreductase subunit D
VVPEQEEGRSFFGPPLPTPRAKRDVRIDEPYDAYDRFKFEAPVRTEGDAYARAWIAYEEMLQSVNIIRQAIEMGTVKLVSPPLLLP